MIHLIMQKRIWKHNNSFCYTYEPKTKRSYRM